MLLTCSRCKIEQSDIHFYICQRDTRGYAYWCIRCCRKYKQEPDTKRRDRERKARAKQRRLAAEVSA